MRIATGGGVGEGLVRGQFRVGISRPRQGYATLVQPGIELLVCLNPSAIQESARGVARSAQASFDLTRRLQYCSRPLCSSIGHPCQAKLEAGQEQEWRLHLPTVAGCRLAACQPSFHLSGNLPLPECVMFRSAPVALRCTLISLDLASLVSGPSAPDLAIFALLSSWVARLVMQPTALHWTSTFGDIICLIKGGRPPSWTIATLFSAGLC